jgi:peroxiredoxin Q/BCP
MISLVEGDKAPHFSGIDQDGNTITLEQFKGKPILLFFYPQDGSSGCTAEVCNLRDHYTSWVEKGFKLVGVSIDSPESHQNFIHQHSLPFPLIADTDKKIVLKYGVWRITEKNNIKTERTMRTTFIISPGGFIEKIITDVNTSDHSKQIELMLALQSEK